MFPACLLMLEVLVAGDSSDHAKRVVESIPTADGARLSVVHRAADGPPVIFLPGLAVNAEIWDLPTIVGRDFVFRSLASVMHDAGYDVWLLNFRGLGAPDMPSAPPSNQADWCVDHFIALDLPAVVEHVGASRGQRPFVIGASMGAMVLAGYLEGVRIEGDPRSPRIVADACESEQRNAGLAGAVFVEFPAALRWPNSPFDDSGGVRWPEILRDWWRTDGDVNYPFELLARSAWLEALIDEAGRVPLQWMRTGDAAERIGRAISPKAAEQFRAAQTALVQAGLNVLSVFTGHSHHRAEVILEGRSKVMDHMKAGVLRQMGKSVRMRGFVSELGSPDYVYSEHYDQVRAPLLVVQGGRDRIANTAVVREVFFDAAHSADKEFMLFDDFAHGEFEAAPVAYERVYPRVLEWIRQRTRQ
ncbi:MAG: alpha/beta fold hydrolase [Phycisphaerae bacterium]